MSWYTVHSFIAAPGSNTDLSSFFNTPGIADPHQANQQWRLNEVSYPAVPSGWTGDVNSEGALVRTSGGFNFHEGETYPGIMELQVQYPTPDSCPVEAPPLAFSGAGASGGGGGGCGSGGCGSV